MQSQITAAENKICETLGRDGKGQRFRGARYTRPSGLRGKAEGRRRRKEPSLLFFPEARGARAGTLPRKVLEKVGTPEVGAAVPSEPVEPGAAAHMEYGGHSQTQPRAGGSGELENTLSRHGSG